MADQLQLVSVAFCYEGMSEVSVVVLDKYEACLESKDTKVLNMYIIFNLQK